MKVMVVTAALGGGILSSLSYICNNLNPTLFEVVLVYSRRAETPSEDYLRKTFMPRIRLVKVDGRRDISPVGDTLTLRRYVQLLGQEKPDIVHFHSSKAGFLGRIAARLVGIPANRVFYSPRGYAFLRSDVSPWKRMLYRKLEKLAARAGGTTVAVSMSEAECAEHLLGQSGVILIENGLDLDTVESAVPPAVKPMGATCVIGTMGRASPQKDPFGFLELAQRITAQYPGRVKFLWIGGGELAEELTRRVKEYDLQSVVRVTGWVTREVAWQQLRDEVDIYLQTSLWEGMPLTLLEAMAFSKPIVARDAVGNRDVVAHGVTGYTAQETYQLAGYLSKLIEDQSLSRQLGRVGRAHLEERYTVNRVIEELQAVYLNAVGGTSRDGKN